MYRKLNVGLPAKKRKFYFLNQENVYGDCVIDGSQLYVLYYKYIHEDDSHVDVRVYNLSEYDGREDECEPLLKCDGIHVGTIKKYGDFLIVGSGLNAIFKKDDGQKIFSEFDAGLPEHWKESGCSFIFDNNYVRQLDGKNPSLGAEVFDVVTQDVIKHIGVDVISIRYIGNGLVTGKRENGNLGVFSVPRNMFVAELDSELYFHCDSLEVMDYHFSVDDSNLAIARNNSVVVLDVDCFEVIHHINCLDLRLIEDIVEQYGINKSHFSIEGVDFCGGRLIVHGNRFFSYVMCLDVSVEEPAQWVYAQRYPVVSKYVGGDLVFGLEDDRPSAWDVYTGEKIWEASADTIANKIQVGDGWLVYSAPAGYIQCFQWKKPYISPRRPSA